MRQHARNHTVFMTHTKCVYDIFAALLLNGSVAAEALDGTLGGVS